MVAIGPVFLIKRSLLISSLYTGLVQLGPWVVTIVFVFSSNFICLQVVQWTLNIVCSSDHTTVPIIDRYILSNSCKFEKLLHCMHGKTQKVYVGFFLMVM